MSWKSMVALGTLGLVHTAFMYTVMYAAFQRLSAQSIAAMSFIYPVVAVLVDLLYFKVSLNEWQWIGMSLIMLAVIADQRKWQISALWNRVAA
ncbi:EamA family transporter [Polaromonas sp. CG_9.11]|uniref:EamA family transporter n=1 Tax=Polaromonas sp. CG_9.11 TaxID=2787730 RepID=UPI0018C91601|nr:EamA family transporter [Polaromonas sp. CG_9.11]